MKGHLKIFCFCLLSLYFLSSCAKVESEINTSNDNDFIKSEWSNNKIVSIFKYNNTGKITEQEGTNNYSKYLYNNENKLSKIETAADVSVYSSSLPIEKTELKSAENSVISSYRIFKYDEEDKLFEIENYFLEEEFIFKSKNSFEFENGKIIKVNLHNENGDISQFHAYEYDSAGNVTNKKYYSYLFTESTQPKLVSEISYKFDNKKNPFKIFVELGNPGLYSNSNNIIETSSILYEETPGIDNHTTSITYYEYNNNNYPIKVITETGEFEYKY